MLAVPAALSAKNVAAAAKQSSIWDHTRRMQIVLEDPLDHPFYWWPRTLLSYPITSHLPADLDSLTLTQTNSTEPVPFQFSDVVRENGTVKSATLNFFSDLPSGARREFILSAAEFPAAFKPQVREYSDGKTIVLDSGEIQIRIPASQSVHGTAPGPILQCARGGKWFGSSVLEIENDTVTEIISTPVENGPLFITYEIAYRTTGGSRYVARVQCNAGQDFVRLVEDMEGMRPGVHGKITADWSDLGITHRQAPNHPFPLPDKILDYDDYNWERIDDPWRSRDIQFGASLAPYPTVFPAGQVPFLLGAFETWTALHIGTFANFWNQQSGDAVGVFIDKVGEWLDHEYAYEIESATLQVSFHHRNGKFLWTWPISRGRRSTCIAFYDHEKDKQAMHQLEQATLPLEKDGYTYHVPLTFTSHLLFLQNRFGTLDLNCVKDWVLEYPEDARRAPVIFTNGSYKDGGELERHIMTSDYVGTLPLFGTRQNGGHGPLPGRSIVNFGPVPSRQIQGGWVDGFNRLSTTMTPRQRKRLTAMFLLVAYVHAGEDFMPLLPMLSGHPNFLADVKATPGAMAFLFPDHPMASTWADLWQKYVELNTRFNTRPAVAAWNADGGRWTEDLGTYVWAFLRPSMRTEYLLQKFDGRERFLSPQLAQMTDWLVGSLSAPFNGESEAAYRNTANVDGGHDWGVLAPGKGPRRVYPAQGSHAEQRVPPRSLWYLGTRLHRYAPLAAEHAMWAARPTDQDMETAIGSHDAWDVMYDGLAENLGTNPHLRSAKFTGYGLVLRGAPETPQEISIHLQQIDRGPNYRWGVTAEGGCGVIYFYANGKSYSMNGAEDVGDRKDQDTDFCTNFGVFRNGSFHSIGENVLSRPFYNLGTGQFAEIVPREGNHSYAVPEYLSRSVLLVGSEYFVVYDAVVDPSLIHRLSWFVRRGDELPNIKLVRGGSPDARESLRTDHQTIATTGSWFDGVGDSMAVVSHHKEIDVTQTPFGCTVKIADNNDLVFRNPDPVHYADEKSVFDGTAGLIRRKNGSTDFALFHGTRIGVDGIVFSTADTELGIGGTIAAGRTPSGDFYAPTASSVTIALPATMQTYSFYIDGVAAARGDNGPMKITLPQGIHHWELTDSMPVPLAPRILRTENFSGGARVVIAPVAAATQYRVELSSDNGVTWKSAATQSQATIELHGLTNGEKFHVRAVAINSQHESAAGLEYPLYVSNQAPPPPDGLHVDLAAGAATVTWGELLGVGEYKLYARVKGAREFQLLYHGPARSYVDKRDGIQSCNAVPGKSSPNSSALIVEYFVAAINGNGESIMSPAANTDPASWRNWDPKPGEPFRRVFGYEPDSSPQPGDQPRYYPA